MPPSRCSLVLPYKTNDFYSNFLSYMQYCSLCMGPETFYNIDTPFILHFYWFTLVLSDSDLIWHYNLPYIDYQNSIEVSSFINSDPPFLMNVV